MDDHIWCFPWFTPKSQRIKLLSCKSFIEYYLGNYIKDPKLCLDQISVNVYKGTGTVCNVILDCGALAKMSTKQNWPVQIKDGRMENITVRIPWTKLFKHDTIFKISGLSLTVQPAAPKSPASILEWVYSKCAIKAHVKTEADHSKNVQNKTKQEEISKEHTDFFVVGVNSIMRRLKVMLLDTKIRFEHIPKDLEQGIAFIIKIDKIEYYYDTNSESLAIETDSSNNKFIMFTSPRKKITFEGLSVFTEKITKDGNDPGGNPNNGMTIDQSLLFDEENSPTLPLKEQLVKTMASDQQRNSNKQSFEPERFAIIKECQGRIIYECKGQFEAPKCEAEINGPIVIKLTENNLSTLLKTLIP